jgi:hypothetical protein
MRVTIPENGQFHPNINGYAQLAVVLARRIKVRQ